MFRGNKIFNRLPRSDVRMTKLGFGFEERTTLGINPLVQQFTVVLFVVYHTNEMKFFCKQHHPITKNFNEERLKHIYRIRLRVKQRRRPANYKELS